MRCKYILGILLVSIFILFMFLLFVGSNNRVQETHIDISNLSMHFINRQDLDALANQSSIEVHNQIEMEIFENYTFKATNVIRLKNFGEKNIAVVPVLYSPAIRFTSITIENAKLLNASILLIYGEDENILLLKIKIPKNKRALIQFEYAGDISTLLGGQTLIGSLFAKYKSPDEIEMPPEVLLPEILNEISETEIILDLPHSWGNWTGIILNLDNSKILEPTDQNNGKLIFTSKGFLVPFIILGDFNIMSYKVENVDMKMYFPRCIYKEVSSRYRNIVSDIIRTFSSWYIPYPYRNLTIIFSSNIMRMSGINRNGSGIILITANATPSLLAHEISHSWFGGYAGFGTIDESLATYSEMSYMIRFYNKHPEELEKYARYNLTTIQKVLNFVEQRVLKYNNDYPKPLSQVYRAWISNSTIRNAIMYNKGAFVFRSLQFVLGNETFFEGLRELLWECHNKECNLTDVQNVFEKVSGQNLDWFFREWFYTAKVPDYEVENLSLEKKDGKYLLTFEIIDKNNFTMPLEVKVKTLTESFIKKIRVNGTARVEFKLDEKPTKIILDPNEWMANNNKEEKIREIGILVN